MLAACSGHSGKVEMMVEELNSEQMQAAERQTGLFTGSEASLQGDTLRILFNLVPGLNLCGFQASQLPALRQSAVAEFRRKCTDKKFREGVEALREENMVLALKWRDSENNEVVLTIPASEILEK